MFHFGRKPIVPVPLGAIRIGFVAILAPAPSTFQPFHRGKEAKIYIHGLERLGFCAPRDVGDQRAGRRCVGRCRKRLALDFRSSEAPGQLTHGGGFHIAFDASDLASKSDVGTCAQAHLFIE